MSEIPADLLTLKVEFLKTDREVTALAHAEPYDSARWRAAHDRLGNLALEISRHPALTSLSPVDRLKLDSAASAAAREQLAAQDSAGG